MNLFKLIVTFFFIGNVKIAPGTIASFVTVVIFYAFAVDLSILSFMLIISAITVLSFFAVDSYTTGHLEKDKSEIVIDEVIGQSIALLPLLIFTETPLPKFFMCINLIVAIEENSIQLIYRVEKTNTENTSKTAKRRNNKKRT